VVSAATFWVEYVWFALIEFFILQKGERWDFGKNSSRSNLVRVCENIVGRLTFQGK
jgi:hypothetical protein